MCNFKTTDNESNFVLNAYVAMAYHANGVNKTVAQKLLFLSEIEYYAKHGKRMTQLEFKSYYHGPFNIDLSFAFDRLTNDNRVYYALNHGHSVYINKEYPKIEDSFNIPNDRLEIIKEVSEKHKRHNATEIKDLVYRYSVYANTRYEAEIKFEDYKPEEIKLQIPESNVLSAGEKISREKRLIEITKEINENTKTTEFISDFEFKKQLEEAGVYI